MFSSFHCSYAGTIEKNAEETGVLWLNAMRIDRFLTVGVKSVAYCNAQLIVARTSPLDRNSSLTVI